MVSTQRVYKQMGGKQWFGKMATKIARPFCIRFFYQTKYFNSFASIRRAVDNTGKEFTGVWDSTVFAFIEFRRVELRRVQIGSVNLFYVVKNKYLVLQLTTNIPMMYFLSWVQY